ncbi:hypothetical protein RH858_12935 [Halalkaliarchaeum sp. AArc-GB]|jgi:hypothetical protein|uniref:hypothetical protein n=1 Tax=Halalkaliarchaeum sp. AArc-GB TaxID=3074078 RepID=UPI0028582C05|nr:hypothetical protein [Halalkaliarchaeum sp. AArc-GB]MDR5674036.1 hypothetical protein [Halalkaliarchaeum sp. AArc-GB]
MPTDEEIKARIETNSTRYGHGKTPQDVFEDQLRPQAYELIDALAASEHLSKKEAIAFVQHHLVSTPTRVELEGESEEFDNPAELKSYALQGKHKVAQAIWIYELIDAYRHPKPPEECRECGKSIGNTWIGHPDKGEPGVLCEDCAGIDPHSGL